MKKNLFFTLLFLIPFFSFSQTTKPIDSFLGIKFGSSKAAVMQALKARGGQFDKANSDADDLMFENLSLGHRKMAVIDVKFVNNKAFEADFYFDPEDNNRAIEYYDGVVNNLNDIYGTAKTIKNFKPPYEDGDGYEITALLTGAADYLTYWTASNENSILAQIQKMTDTKLMIELIYQDSELFKQALAKQKAQDKGDY